MYSDSLFGFRIAAGFVWLLTVVIGVVLAKNIEKIVPSKNTAETESERSYARFLLFAVWAHFFVLSGSFALFVA